MLDDSPLVNALNRFSGNNNLKYIIHAGLIAAQKISIPISSDLTKTAEKTVELDTKTLTDLLLLRWILDKYQKDQQVINNSISTMMQAQKISNNVTQILDEAKVKDQNLKFEDAKLTENPVVYMMWRVYEQFLYLYCDVNKFKLKFRLDNRVNKIENNQGFPDKLKYLFNAEHPLWQKNFTQLLPKLKTAQMRLDKHIMQFINAVTWNKECEESDVSSIEKDKPAELILPFFEKYVESFGVPELNQRPSIQTRLSRSEQLLDERELVCMLNPTIEDKIAQFLTDVMKLTLNSVDSSQNNKTDQKAQTDEFNSRLLTIGGVAILGVVTIGAGWYLFLNDNDNNNNTTKNGKIRSNDDNNTASNRKMQLSRKTTTSMQLSKPEDVSATETTDVSAHNDNTDITTKSVTTSTTTHQEQTSANKQIK
jgi:hypothetical protein